MDVNAVLLDILIVLVAAKVAAEIADRIGIPAVVGEIIAGVLVGPSVLDLVEPNDVLHTLAEVGVILLLLQVGLEMDLADLRSVGRASLLVALIGVVVPMVGGAAAGLALGMDGNEALFVGAALTATSVGITARVFGDLRALASVEARTVLGAAVADDVLGLVILTVVVRIVTEGSVSALTVIEVVGVALAFVVLATAVAIRVAPPMFRAVRRYSRSTGTLVAMAFAFTLALSELAHAADLAPIIGAFVAGLALTRTPAADRIRGELAPIGHLLIPVFFLQIGIDTEIDEFAHLDVLGLAGALLVVAIIGKVVAAAGLFGRPGDRMLVGIGMIPRGEVGLIFAAIGLREGVFGQDIYGALILVVLATTIITPPALRWRLLRLRAARRATASGGVADARVQLDDAGRVTITGEPLPANALALALEAARLSAHAPPADALLEWLDAFPPGTRRWSDAARDELWRLLEEGGSRSWRLLLASGVLMRALPELDEVLDRSHHDAIDIDPLSTLHFRRLEGVRAIAIDDTNAGVRRPVMLAALVLDACENTPDEPVALARRTVQRLDVDATIAQAVEALVADAELLVAAARRVDAFDEESVLELAVHLADREHARALRLLTIAELGDDTVMRERVDALYQLVEGALAQPELTGSTAANEVGRRVVAACMRTEDEAVQDRIRAAPRAYILRSSAIDVARHARLCEQVSGRDDVRVQVELGRDGYCVDVATRDRVGVLAAITHALAEAGCSVAAANVVTWGDGVALSSFRVDEPPPDVASLRGALKEMVGVSTETPPMDDVGLRFDDHGSPWYTRCTVEADDRPGLLDAVTTAFAQAGVNVHAARITTTGAHASNLFELTERNGAKLGIATQARVREMLARGSAANGKGRRRRVRSRDASRVGLR